MNKKIHTNQDFYSAGLAVWSILASAAILLVDEHTFILALALLVMIVIFTTTRLFRASSFISLIAGAGIYLASYFSIFPFSLSLSALTVPGMVVIIFILTSILGSILIRQMNKKVNKLDEEVHLLNNLIQYDAETDLLLWKHARLKLDAELARCRRYHKTFTLIFFAPAETSLENLSTENRKELNQNIAKLLLKTCRTDVDTPFIGNHFGVILPETDANGAEVFARRLISNSTNKMQIDLRIATASFPENGVTPEDMIAACEEALQLVLKSDSTILHANNIIKPKESSSIEVEADHPAARSSEASDTLISENLNKLGADEYLLNFSGLYNMTDLPLIQESLASFKEIEDINLLEYSNGRIVFKLKSKINLSDKHFSQELKNRLTENWISKNKKES